MYIWRKQVRPDWLRLRSENLSARFGAALAIVERPGRSQILLQISCPTLRQANAMAREFGGRAQKLPRDWLRDFASRAERKPLYVGSRLIVLARPDQMRGDRSGRTIIIPAESAFGTGEHATTAMCMRLLERHTRKRPPGWSLLDAGTGSGILAIAGRFLGAAHVVALDNDPVASVVARRNARSNGVRDVEFRTSDLLTLKLSKKFNVVTANLFSELLISALPVLSRHLARDGLLILSGILRSQEKAVHAALYRHRFDLQEVRRRGKWVALLAVKAGARRTGSTRKNS